MMENLVAVLVLAGAACLYLLPCGLAIGKRNGMAIALLNLFLGWTFLIWIVCFIWACVSPREVGNEN